MENLETLATLDTQDTGQINVRENRREQSRIHNLETLATLDTQDTRQINVRENQRVMTDGESRYTGNIGYTRHKTQDK